MKTFFYVIIGIIILFGGYMLLPKKTTSPNMNTTPSNNSTAATTTANRATIQTDRGDIVVELYPDVAPHTVTNFVNKAKSNFYNGLIFHRVEDWVVQGGDPLGNGTGGGTMATELNSKPFVAGSLGVARGQDIKVSNDAQFFIVKTDASWLDNQYTNFGKVVQGMDVVNQIQIGDHIKDVIVN